jgi:hypothetical protein
VWCHFCFNWYGPLFDQSNTYITNKFEDPAYVASTLPIQKPNVYYSEEEKFWSCPSPSSTGLAFAQLFLYFIVNVLSCACLSIYHQHHSQFVLMRNGSYLIFTLIGVEAMALVIMPPYFSLNLGYGCCFIVFVMMAVGLVMMGKDVIESKDAISEVNSELQIPATLLHQDAEVRF